MFLHRIFILMYIILIYYYPYFDVNTFFQRTSFFYRYQILNIIVFSDIGPILRLVARYYCLPIHVYYIA